MKESVIIINGSPRKKGYSSQISEYIGQKLKNNNISFKIYNIYDMNIDYCTNCGYCSKVRACRIKDDMEDLYKHFDDSVSTILVSPVAFDGPIAKVKTLIDRTNVIFHSKYTLGDSLIDRSKKRIGFHIQVGGSTPYESQFEGGRLINGFFFKAINSKLKHELRIFNTDKMNPFKDKAISHAIEVSVETYIKELISIIGKNEL